MLHVMRLTKFLPFVAASLCNAAGFNIQTLFGPQLSPDARIIVPASGNNLTTRWSTWNQPTYNGAIIPATEQDVATIVKIAGQNNISFLATGGGHGASINYASVKNGIDIDLSNFNSVEVDAANNKLTIGGATKFGQIFQPLYDAGKEVQTGNAECPGMVGVTIGAGVGTMQGLHGLVLDALASVRLVTASGDIINVSNTENSDLLPALRGAGANFGIITSATYNIHDAINNGQVVNADFAFPASSNHSVWELLRSYDSYIPAPMALTVSATYNHTISQAGLIVNVVYYGPQSEVQPHLDNITALGPTRSRTIAVPWPQLSTSSMFGGAAGQCTHGQYINVYGIGLGQTDVPTYEQFLADYVAFNEANPSYNGIFLAERYSNVASLEQPSGSAIYPWRDTKIQLSVICSFGIIFQLFQNIYPDSSLDGAVDSFMSSSRSSFHATSGFTDQHIYVNYDHGDEGPAAWYGQNNLPGLVSLKNKYDPQNLFGRGNPVH